MNPLRIRLFGGLGLSHGDAPLAPVPTQKARSLLAYLVLHRDRSLHRDVICGTLWGECTEAEARKALRTALWRLRSVLEPGEADRGAYLRTEGDEVAFPGTAAAWVDTAEFEACVAGITPDLDGELPVGQAERLTRAVSLYRGDLLDGLYDDWCCQERERFRLACLTALERLLAHYQARGQWLAAISAARQILRTDALREHVHRRLMVCHASMGDRPSALRQFEHYDRLVRDELGVEPLAETRALYRQIREEGTLPASRPANGGPSSLPLATEIDEAVRSLHALIARLESVRPGALSARAPDA
jgi:DNA-binding SARP family transcriptional activator